MGFLDNVKDALKDAASKGDDAKKVEAPTAEEPATTVPPTIPESVATTTDEPAAETTGEPPAAPTVGPVQPADSVVPDALDEKAEQKAEEKAAHRAERQEERREERQEARQEARHEARHEARQEAREEAREAKATTFETYTVRAGDSLSEIGARFGVSYEEIARLNKIDNPDLIFPGQVFRIPTS